MRGGETRGYGIAPTAVGAGVVRVAAACSTSHAVAVAATHAVTRGLCIPHANATRHRTVTVVAGAGCGATCGCQRLLRAAGAACG